MTKKLYFSNLDSLRLISFLLVFGFHFKSRIPNSDNLLLSKIFKFVFTNGYVGVSFFFVLSGFLITYLLLTEEVNFKRYNIINFWVRRILRIWPLYLGMVFYGFGLFRWLNYNNINYHETAELSYYLFFIPNLNIIHNGYPLCTTLVVLWSIGIEEQFYLLWPLLLWRKSTRIIVLFIILTFSILYRYFFQNNSMLLSFHTFSFLGDLTIGASLALISFNRKILQESIFINKFCNLIVYLIGISFILTNHIIFQSYPQLIFLKNLILCSFFCYILFEQIFCANPIYRLGQIKWMNNYGKYTYGLYCFHPIGIMIGLYFSKFLKMENFELWIITLEFVVSIISTFILSILSFNLFEKHFLKLKELRFS